MSIRVMVHLLLLYYRSWGYTYSVRFSSEFSGGVEKLFVNYCQEPASVKKSSHKCMIPLS